MPLFGSNSCTAPVVSGYSRRGFTLFEVSISLVLIAFGVVSVLMLFPAGLKAQQMARFQIYAAAKAEEMIEQFNGTQHSNPAIDSEGLAMWDVPVAHKAQSWDLYRGSRRTASASCRCHWTWRGASSRTGT